MSKFNLSFKLFDRMFHGRNASGAPEWPPSPMRAFQALVDAAANRWRSDSHFNEHLTPALMWLEALAPPDIKAPVAEVAGSAYRLYVPNNHADVVAAAWERGNANASIAEHRTEKDVRPMHLLGGAAIHYLWELPDPTAVEAYTTVLQAAARSITHLGWGVDMVAGNASVISDEDAARLPGERWRPAEVSAADGLRVPKDGTLVDLARKHEAFLSRLSADGFKPVPPLSANAYRVVGYRRDHDPASRPFAAFKLLHPETGEMRSYTATDCVRVAGMIRGAAGQVASASGRDSDWVDQFIYGHHQGPETFPRFSYLPLPSIQPHVGVGRIRRVLIAELPGADGREKTWMSRLLSGYVAPNEQGRDALLVPLTRDNVLSRYTAPSEVWTTATPIALPGCDDGKPDKRDRLFAKAFQHAGYSLSALKEIEFRRFPFIAGAEDALKYRPSGDHYLRRCSVYHVRLRWRNPFKGPLALGSGRHCGLGVFARTND